MISMRLMAAFCLTASLALASCTGNQPRSLAAVHNNGTVPMASDKPLVRGAQSGRTQTISHYASINPDCSNKGYAAIKVVKAPEHGTVSIEQGVAYPNFAKDNVRWACNSQQVPVIVLSYTSEPGFVGSDTVSVEGVSAGGAFIQNHFVVNVR